MLIFRENLTSEFDSACLNPATVHFPIGGMDGEAEAYDDDGDCNGCPDGGGKRRPRGLGEGVAGVVGLRPRAEAWAQRWNRAEEEAPWSLQKEVPWSRRLDQAVP